VEKFFERLLSIDRKIIFLLIALSTSVPLFYFYPQDIIPNKASRMYNKAINKLEEKRKNGKDVVVLVSGEYDPGTVPELSPMARATFKRLLDMKAKIIIMGLVPMGPPLLMEEFNDLLKDPKYSDVKYGVDYVNLGYTVGNAVVVKGMAKSIKTKYPVDVMGTDLDELPLMKKVKNFDNIDMIVDFSSMGGGVKTWIQFAKKTTEESMDIVFGCTGVMVPESYPYLNSGQIKGLLGGLKGAADYEALIKETKDATKYIFAQSIAHVVIMLFIVIGNIAFFITRKKKM
jgi:hypothetical protein